MNTKKSRYLASLQTRKPGTTGSLSPHNDSQPGCVPYTPTTPCHALTPRPRAVLVIQLAWLLSLKILVFIGTVCQQSQHFRRQTPTPKLMLLPQAEQKSLSDYVS